MYPLPFTYTRASSLDEALTLLTESNGEAKVMAGGHSLIPLMKMRLTSPKQLIDISNLQELKGVRLEDGRLHIGALTTHAEVARHPLVIQHAPLLAETARKIGDIQVRNKGTMGGNLSHADPSSDLPAAAIALRAEVFFRTEMGEEHTEIESFFLGPLVTALPENGIMTSVSFAIREKGNYQTYMKFAHPASGYCVAGVAASVTFDADGAVQEASIGVTGASDTPFRAEEAEKLLKGRPLSEAAIGEAALNAHIGGVLTGDLYADESYRKHLIQVYTTRVLRRILRKQKEDQASV